MELKDNYLQPLALTSQFRFCGNPFRLDFYRFCPFGCKYCFARNLNGKSDFEKGYAKFSIIERLFKRAFETDEKDTITLELLRHKVPIHIGGLSDPFQPIEFQFKLNYKLIELSNKYNYPLIFSTKQCYLPDEYYEILNPKLHAFQISLMGLNEEYVRKYETNSPTPQKRLEFLNNLRSKGFWCSIRIQPIVDINEVLKLCEVINGVASYVTLEHIKINIENKQSMELFKDIIPMCSAKSKTRDLEIPTLKKIENIERIKKVLTKTKIGIGDNDLHYLSQSRCCCGVDTINENFDSYLKYNLTYFTTEQLSDTKACDETYFIPKSKVGNILNSEVRIKNVDGFKDYVDLYCGKHSDFMCETCSMKHKLDGVFFNSSTAEKLKQVSIFSIDKEEGEL